MNSSGIMFELTLKFRTRSNCVDFFLSMCLFIYRKSGPLGVHSGIWLYHNCAFWWGDRNGAKLDGPIISTCQWELHVPLHVYRTKLESQ